MKHYLMAALLTAGILSGARAETNSKQANLDFIAVNDFGQASRVETDLAKPDPAALKRWQDLRFGMFIHWGPVSLTGRDISWSRGDQIPIEKYDALCNQFNPTEFNADEWVAIAKAAGIKYIVFVTKHHDGFCLWDTKLSDYNIMNTPFKRDVVKELADACKKADIAFGAYYSAIDWHDPNFPTTSPRGRVKREKYDLDAYEKLVQAQNAELITNYGPLITMWYDGVYPDGPARNQRLAKLVRKLQPDILIGRLGGFGDYETPEQVIGGFNLKHPWETCATVSKHNNWAWGGAKDGVKSVEECLQMLIMAAGGDGNLLLNVGPRPDGVIDPDQVRVVKEVGDWLAKHGESIYGTHGGPYKPAKCGKVNFVGVLTDDFPPTASQWGASTRKGNTIYLHITQWIGDTLTLPALSKKITGSKLLTGGSVKVKQTDTGVAITVPAKDHQKVDTVVELTLEGPAMEIEPITVERANGIAGKVTASAASHSWGAEKAFDGDPASFWLTPEGTREGWIAIEMLATRKVVAATVEVAPRFANYIEAYEFQAEVGGAWRTLCAGGKLGVKSELKFEPVTAQKFRLNITKANNVMSINEIRLQYAPTGEAKAFSGLASAALAFDENLDTAWTADDGSRAGWIEIDLPAAKKVASATVEQEIWFADRIEAYEFQAEVDGAWKTLCAGGKTGAECVLKFAPVTAQKFRLNITKANDAPKISEVELK